MRKISQEDIYRYYLGDITIGEMYRSPIPGRGDRTPSFGLYIGDAGTILWKDFGLPNQYGNKVENLVQYLEGLELTVEGFYKARSIIVKKLQMDIIGKPLTKLKKKASNSATPYILEKPYEDFELKYWDRFGIGIDDLVREDITPLKSVNWRGNTEELTGGSRDGNPAFIYWWNRNPASWKIYRPLADKRDKFRQENIHGVIEGWNTLGDNHLDILFITSSTKDRLVIKKCFSGENINSINPRSESDHMDIVAKKDHLKSLADRVIILLDADDAGYDASNKLADLTGFEWYDMRHQLPTPNGDMKDFSDYVDKERGNCSYDDLKSIVKRII